LDERARLRIGIFFQRVPVICGVKTRDMVGAAMRHKGGKVTIDKLAERANMTELLDRELELWFFRR